MMHLLAQSGGGPGGFSNPQLFKVLIYAVFAAVFLLGTIIKKINERNAKREVEQAKLRRQDQILRTGRAEDGSVARAPAAGPGMPTMASPDDARRKLQELAERRRRELAEMMRRAQGGAAPASAPQAPPSIPRAPAEAPPRRVPPVILGSPLPAPVRRPAATSPRPQRPAAAPVFSSARQPGEKDIRRQREAEANKKAAKEAAARRKAQEQRPREQAIAARPTASQSMAERPESAAATVTTSARATASAAARVALSGANLGVMGGPAEWRRAIVISEIMGAPVSMR